MQRLDIIIITSVIVMKFCIFWTHPLECYLMFVTVLTFGFKVSFLKKEKKEKNTNPVVCCLIAAGGG